MREPIISREINIHVSDIVIYDTTINATRIEKVQTFEPLNRKTADKLFNTATATVVMVNEVNLISGIYEMTVSDFLAYAKPVKDRRGIVTKEITYYLTNVTRFNVDTMATESTVIKDIRPHDFKSASKIMNREGKTVVKVEPISEETAVYGMSYDEFIARRKTSTRKINHK